MRTVIGWMAAMFASALLGAAVYQTVLTKPLPELDPTATVEVTADPSPAPTLYRTEVQTVVDPAPTITVDDEVLVEGPVVPASQPRTANPAPVRTSAPNSNAQATAEREDDDSDEESFDRDDEESEDRAQESDDDKTELRDDESDDEAEDRDDKDDDEDSEDD